MKWIIGTALGIVIPLLLLLYDLYHGRWHAVEFIGMLGVFLLSYAFGCAADLLDYLGSDDKEDLRKRIAGVIAVFLVSIPSFTYGLVQLYVIYN